MNGYHSELLGAAGSLRDGFWRALAIVLLTLLMPSCATAPPVQALSDARQAIAAAREAGAMRFAPEALTQAEGLLDTAESLLQSGSTHTYWQARKAANRAKEVAFEALLISRNARDAVVPGEPL